MMGGSSHSRLLRAAGLRALFITVQELKGFVSPSWVCLVFFFLSYTVMLQKYPDVVEFDIVQKGNVPFNPLK